MDDAPAIGGEFEPVSAAPHMDVELVAAGECIHLRLLGRLDFSSALDLPGLAGERAGGFSGILILDLSLSRLIDSSGFAALLQLHRNCEEAGGALWLAAPPKHTQLALKMSRLDQVLRVKDDLESAFASAARKPA